MCIPELAKCMIVMFSGSYIEKITNSDGIFHVKASKSNTNLVFLRTFARARILDSGEFLHGGENVKSFVG